jgi:hypothetical protein
LTIGKLACLCETLRKNRTEYKTFGVFIFDSYEAAKHFMPLLPEGSPTKKWYEWARSNHAVYSFEADKHEENLDIMPTGYMGDPSLTNTFDLPLSRTQRCTVEVQNRCLIAAMEEITYPQEALRTRGSGAIDLEGVIGRDGAVTGLHLTRADVKPSGEKGRLANAALRDLRTWRFDAAEQSSPIRIVYSFAVDSSLAPGAAPKVRWTSPDHVSVRANPPE